MNTDFPTASGSTMFALLAIFTVMLIMPDKCRAFDCVHGEYRPIQLDDKLKSKPKSFSPLDMFPKELAFNIGLHVEVPTDVGVRLNCAFATPLILAILLIALLFYHHH
ncbi:hypothetical protein niasHT_010896 [Heterodera trifolii]|uniref:Uncharacterized protein n=1 Tax=Heterodera trifolii TaxID=157864 RepID=A0ABD2KVU6_9BILA